MNKLVVFALACAAAVGCARHESAVTSSTTQTTATTSAAAAPAATATTATTTPQQENLASLAAGATIAVKPASLSDPYYLLDDDDRTGWTTDKLTEPVVIELGDRSTIRTLGFATRNDEIDSRYPKEVLVEMSDAGPASGFQPIATLQLPAEALDGKSFPVTAQVPGRWLRLTAKSAQSGEIVQIMELQAFGDRLTHDAAPNVTGSWDLDAAGKFELKQDGTSVSGCIDERVFVGGLEGGVLKFPADFRENGKGPAVLVISGDGKRLAGGWWRSDSAVESRPPIALLQATKKSDAPQTCAAWKQKDPLESELEQQKRVRLYGINFDVDSDQIRAESKPTLDKLAAILKTNAAWKITIEGHTDSTATAEHNQELSARRAESVKSYLAAAGVDATRLTATGRGATQPLATNDTSLGRAQNRRVEIVRE
jgi:outer membrane protein OmpA-like peptidoglycan-associated protein